MSKRHSLLCLLSFLVVVRVAAADSADPAWTPSALDLGSYVASDPVGVELDSDLASPQLVGTAVHWTATPAEVGDYEHRFRVLRLFALPDVVVDVAHGDGFDWTPVDPGFYLVFVESRNRETGEVSSGTASYTIDSPQGPEPAVLPTRNPLVALYSASPDAAGQATPQVCLFPGGCRMRVAFRADGASVSQRTKAKPIEVFGPTSLYVGGLHPETSYELQFELLDAADEVLSRGPVVEYETPAAGLTLPAATLRIPRQDSSVPSERVLLVAPLAGPPYATDLKGRLLWYDATHSGRLLLTQAVAGGTFLELELHGSDGVAVREVDLAGGIRKRTTMERLNEQLAAMGEDRITSLHHEATRLPGGRTALLGNVIRTPKGVPDELPATLVGDCVMVLDADLQLQWVWNSFDHLDVARPPTLGETCVQGQAGCSGIPAGIVAQDWTHSNAIEYSPDDGNLLVSMRNQDWILKVDYEDGRGSGAVLWRLGPEGDFSIDSGDAYPWASHAHDPRLLSDGRVAVYDNGNTRCALGLGCESRGQVYALDEVRMQAELVENVPLERYSFALGSAHGLRDGGVHFGTGIFALDGVVGNSSEEVRDGQIVHSLFQPGLAYRSFRMRDLYSPPPGVFTN